MYDVVIGLEVHCELKTKSKVFSKGANIYTEHPNSNLSVVDLGFPGILPVINKEAVRKAIKVAMGLNCRIPNYLLFDRKNYFYPDLPKGYQITQMHQPFGEDGYLMINVDECDKKVLIHDLHLEEDTASLDHFGSYSLIDYNRAGIPLIEIVTEPCMSSAKEVLTFLDALRKVIIYLDASDARTDKGQMRCDVNISLKKKDSNELGTKVEIKNINSFNNVKDAIEYEIKRQTEILNNNGTIVQETRRFDDDKRKTISMRTKVEAVDYKYFVEPNIPKILLTDEFLKEIKDSMVPLQYERVTKYMNEYNLSRYDSNILVKEREISDYFEQTLLYDINPKSSANWINGVIMGHINKYELNITDIFVTPKMLTDLIKLVESNQISIKQGKEVLYKALTDNINPLDIVEKSNMKNINDDTMLREIALKILENNQPTIEKYKEGRNVLDFFIGQMMKETKGSANPSLASQIFKEELEKY